MKKLFLILISVLSIIISYSTEPVKKVQPINMSATAKAQYKAALDILTTASATTTYATKVELGAKPDTSEVNLIKDNVNPQDYVYFKDESVAKFLVKDGTITSQNLQGNIGFNTDTPSEKQEVNGNVIVATQGSNKVTNGTFTTDVSFTKGTGTTISGGTANFDGTAALNAALLTQNISASKGKIYKITLTVTARSSGSFSIYIGGYESTGQMGAATGDYSVYLKVLNSSANNLLEVTNGSGTSFVGSIDNLVITEVIGGNETIGGNLTVNLLTNSIAKYVTLGAGATSIPITSNVTIVTGDTGNNTISTITGGISGAVITLIFTDAKITITDTSAGAANTVNLSAAFTSAAYKTLTLVHNGSTWLETARSTN